MGVMFVLLITHNSVTHYPSPKFEADAIPRYPDTPIPRYVGPKLAADFPRVAVSPSPRVIEVERD